VLILFCRQVFSRAY